MVGPDLYFIRTDDGYVQVLSATAASGYRSGIDVTTRFLDSSSDGDYQLSNGNLYFLKLWDDKYVQVHSANSSSGYQSGINELSRFTSSPKAGDWWIMSGPNLYMIKAYGSGSHDVEVHSATAASGYRSGIDVATRFGEADAQYGWWQIGSES
jgi:phage-related tail fiber protein